jgi:hypothetical protein
MNSPGRDAGGFMPHPLVLDMFPSIRPGHFARRFPQSRFGTGGKSAAPLAQLDYHYIRLDDDPPRRAREDTAPELVYRPSAN